MTKFSDLLGKAGGRQTEPLGFGRGSRRAVKTPDILLVGRITEEELTVINTKGSPLDAYLLEVDAVNPKMLGAASNALDGTIWGLRLSSVTENEKERVKKSGVDFIAFDASNTPASVLSDEELGAFVAVCQVMSEEDAQAVHSLPVDGVAVELDGGLFPFTVEALIRLHRPLTSGTHALVLSDFDPKTLSAGDLEAMRGAGVSALALPATGAGLQALRETIASLPEPKPDGDDRMALIPRSSASEEPDDFDDEADF